MTEYDTTCDWCGEEIKDGDKILTIEVGDAEFQHIGDDAVILNQGSTTEEMYHLECAVEVNLIEG